MGERGEGINQVFLELGLLIILAAVAASLVKLLKQPIIIAYIFTGILASPALLNWAGHTESIAAFAQMGVVLLLFIVGITLNPKVIKELGMTSFLVGTAQVMLTAVIGYGLGIALGFSSVGSIYIGIALAFSSTIIVMKILSDRQELDTLQGKLATGILIVQDVLAILVLLIMSSFLNGSYQMQPLLPLFFLIVACLSIGFFLIPKIGKFVASSQEVLFLFSLGWLMAVTLCFSAFGLPIEIGGLIAGITLSVSDYRFEISSKLKPLRDFFLLLFFVMLGTQLALTGNINVLAVVLLILTVLIIKPLITMVLLGMRGYPKRTNFLASSALAQISEFSLIIVALGVSLGHLGQDLLVIITLVGISTIALSAYFMSYQRWLYSTLSIYLNVFQKRSKTPPEKQATHDIVLFGCNRIGHSLISSFKKLKKQFLIVDYNPETVESMAKEGYTCLYGDVNDAELLALLDFSRTRMVVSTIPNKDTNILLLKKLRQSHKHIIVILVSHDINEALELYEHGATYVLMPHFLGGEYASAMIERIGFNIDDFIKEKMAHLEHLHQRKQLGHEHPVHERKR